MFLIRQNIWLGFYIFLILGLVSFAFILTKTHRSIEQTAITEQENLARITSNSVATSLQQFETLLDVIGQELISEQKYQDTALATLEIAKLLKTTATNHSLLLIDINGDVLASYSAIQKQSGSSFNILSSPKVIESFQRTLTSKRAIVGRTYYSDWHQTLIIPIRKAIRDEQGKAVFVVSLTIDIEKDLPFFSQDRQPNNDLSVFIYRETDRYFQVAPQRSINDPSIYEHQFPLAQVNKSIAYVEKKYKKSYADIKSEQFITTHTPEISDKNTHTMMSSLFISGFDLWVGVERNTAIIQRNFYDAAAYLSFAFVFSYGLIFWLFRIISNNERKKEEQLTYRATHDFLTDLPNRFYLDSYFQAPPQESNFHLLFVDLDNFKAANDNFGHDFGDHILIEISQRLKRCCDNQRSLVTRYSGDEFIILAFDLDSSQVEKLATHILQEIAKPCLIRHNRIQLSASIGIAHCPTDANSFEKVKRLSDFALYESKKNKNAYTLFHIQLQQRYLDDLSLENQLKDALKNHEINIVYQPQVNKHGELLGLESLVRWNNKAFGAVPPNKFIPVAEQAGLMPEIGRFIINSALKGASALAPLDFSLSINISVKQFYSSGFAEYVLQQVEQSGIPAERLKIEITESLFIQDIDYVLGIIKQLKTAGISISLDDFGTGYSSLSLLKKLPIDELKIDKSFVDDIVEDQSSRALLQGIIDIADRMDFSIVAEGVETEEQLEILDHLGCDIYQGYYFYKPSSQEDIANLFLKNNLKD